ncbi:hypothetical protein CYMTET_39907 [Cymbomonas tetramitiformis]|uniref:EF-hand domain-containing protein n=1 Tax=Cymbomonas tetramitiformis TaxID=36881 RepID=A0AAE0CA82_9CHLO|nr:hypothetical protein CYMTET_39907 [Cymbomonas tetramitiformis]
MYEIYNMLNKRFPGWSDPPTRATVVEAIKKYDRDGDMLFDKDEFHTFMSEFLYEHSQVLWARMVKSVGTQVGLLPAAAPSVKSAVGLPAAVPDSVLSPIIATVSKAIKP